MSVIVMGMEMPESCAKCKLKTWTNTDPYCTAIQSKLDWNKYSSGSWVGIDKRCPLRPLPEKHGRLIDADALMMDVKKNSESYFADDFAHEWVDCQQTIVEAEGMEDG